MNKETTVEDFVNYFIKNACCYCHHYKPLMGICGGEVLPIEQAIFKNIDGRGLCEKVKEIDRILRGET